MERILIQKQCKDTNTNFGASLDDDANEYAAETAPDNDTDSRRIIKKEVKAWQTKMHLAELPKVVAKSTIGLRLRRCSLSANAM
jgi:hypothetical protein